MRGGLRVFWAVRVSEHSLTELGRVADDLRSLDHATSETAGAAVLPPAPPLQDHFRARGRSSPRESRLRADPTGIFPSPLGSLPIRITQPPVLRGPPPPPARTVPYLQLCRAMNKDRQLVLRDPVTNSIRAYLSPESGREAVS